MRKKTFIILALFSFAVYSVLVVLLFNTIYKDDISNREIFFTAPIKSINNNEKMIAYYNKNCYYCDLNTILESKIINDDCKREFNECVDDWIKAGSTSNDIKISFIIKDGKDIVFIDKYLDNEYLNQKNIKTKLYFESNLEYSFSLIIDSFNETYGISLDDEFLNDVNDINKGIYIDFVKNAEGTYIPFYYIYNDGMMLVINR